MGMLTKFCERNYVGDIYLVKPGPGGLGLGGGHPIASLSLVLRIYLQFCHDAAGCERFHSSPCSCQWLLFVLFYCI